MKTPVFSQRLHAVLGRHRHASSLSPWTQPSPARRLRCRWDAALTGPPLFLQMLYTGIVIYAPALILNQGAVGRWGPLPVASPSLHWGRFSPVPPQVSFVPWGSAQHLPFSFSDRSGHLGVPALHRSHLHLLHHHSEGGSRGSWGSPGVPGDPRCSLTALSGAGRDEGCHLDGRLPGLRDALRLHRHHHPRGAAGGGSR